MRDVNNGWAVRYTHANVASFFFIFVYAQLIYINYSCFSIFNKLTLNFYACLLDFYSRRGIIESFLNVIKFSSKPYNNTNTLNVNAKNNREFLQQFLGFSDAESAFMISIKNNREVHFVFQITLYIADVAVLHTIKNKLGIGLVSI